MIKLRNILQEIRIDYSKITVEKLEPGSFADFKIKSIGNISEGWMQFFGFFKKGDKISICFGFGGGISSQENFKKLLKDNNIKFEYKNTPEIGECYYIPLYYVKIEDNLNEIRIDTTPLKIGQKYTMHNPNKRQKLIWTYEGINNLNECVFIIEDLENGERWKEYYMKWEVEAWIKKKYMKPYND